MGSCGLPSAKGKPGAIRGRKASEPTGPAELPEEPGGLAGLPDGVRQPIFIKRRRPWRFVSQTAMTRSSDLQEAAAEPEIPAMAFSQLDPRALTPGHPKVR